MDHREEIIEAAVGLIREQPERFQELTVREICHRAQVGLGLVNYHFGNKEHLLEICIERVVNDVVARFGAMQKQMPDLPPRDKLEYLGNLTLDFLLEHEAICRVSVLTDLTHPKPRDNTHRTFEAYLPLLAACRPDWEEENLRRKTFQLITVMQQAFLRRELLLEALRIDLREPEQRRLFHHMILEELLGESK